MILPPFPIGGTLHALLRHSRCSRAGPHAHALLPLTLTRYRRRISVAALIPRMSIGDVGILELEVGEDPIRDKIREGLAAGAVLDEKHGPPSTVPFVTLARYPAIKPVSSYGSDKHHGN